jgi:vacuolar-type H+-ATPase catalytic subunit A/Vma1
VALGQDQFLVRVVQYELPLGEGVVELSPVVVQRVTVLVVLGPDLVRQVFDGVPEFRPLAVTDNLRFHDASIPLVDLAGGGSCRC